MIVTPENGLYSFNVVSRHASANKQQAHLYVNRNLHSYAGRAKCVSGGWSNVNLDATLKLKKNDKVHVELVGQVYAAFDVRTIYFEGRMIARLDQ